MTPPAAPSGPLRVLLCDDNDMLRAALAEVVGAQPDLALAGSAANADEAIRLATAQRPHVVVLDVRFPGGGPYTAEQILRAVPGVRILAFSAYGDQGPRTEMAAVGVAGYLVKGITNARLLAEVRALGAEALKETPSVRRRGSRRMTAGRGEGGPR
ncbi:response regulator transcription factor [Streptomyces sp. KS 21]|uniref:response regulator n=1 Tax=Streptomyces sp. KS 21 TaxID=2485150 RepID=UPI0010ECDDF1|nr:response regulator transcription factor [Streptomyces sp. KS 21]TDU73758.1 response regulator receiver domain-containing protein [Streptomyces sp. KS 21]